MSGEIILRAAAAISESAFASTALKATVAMAVSVVLLRLLRRAPAALRHSIIAATFGALLFLPVASMFIPAQVVRFTAPPAVSTPHETVAVSPARAGDDSSTVQIAAQREPINIAAIAFRVYIAGAVFFLVSLLAGVARLHRIAQNAKVSVAGTRLANEAARAEPMSGGIEVAVSSELGVPVTFRSPHPIILLPAASDEWSEEDLRRVIRHELEHIARGDWLTQIVCRVACAIYWPHPFAWMLWQRLRLEAEQACDDAVIRSRGEAESYAEQLVVLARRLAGSVPALAMATPSSLGLRVEAILDRERRRSPLTRASSIGVAVVAMICMVAVAPVKVIGAAADTIELEVLGEDHTLDVALFHAAQIGDVQIIRRYLDLGAKANAVIRGDGSPLIGAARHGHIEAMNVLIAAGADVNRGVSGDGTPLIAAAKEGHLDAVRLLLDRSADIDRGVQGDGNALIMAAGAGRAEIVRYLLDRGASIEKVVPGDENALIHASESGQAVVVRLLLERGANVNARVWSDFEWRTPLVMARRNGHDEVVKILLAAGAAQ